MYRTEIPISCVGVHSLGICNTEKIPVSYLEVASWEFNYNGIPISHTDVASWEQDKYVLKFPLAVKPSWLTASPPFPLTVWRGNSCPHDFLILYWHNWRWSIHSNHKTPISLMKWKFAGPFLAFFGKYNAVQDRVHQTFTLKTVFNSWHLILDSKFK